jgi:hypothetical protein
MHHRLMLCTTLALVLSPGARAEDPDPSTRVPMKMMPSVGTRGGDFLASDGYGSFMTTPFGNIGLCWDVGFTFNPYDGALDPVNAPYEAQGSLDFSNWNTIYPWYGLACGDQIILSQGAVGSPGSMKVDFASLRAADVEVDEFRGVHRATRHTEFTMPNLPGIKVTLDQRAECATLEKRYAFTNTTDQPITFRLTNSLDADLQWGTRPGWGQWGYCHNFGRFVSKNEVRAYSRDKDIWTAIRIETDPADTGLAFEGCRVFVNGCMGGYTEHNRARANGGIAVDFLNGTFNQNNVNVDADKDGWQDYAGDTAISCQGTFTLAPGQTSLWTQYNSAGPSRCELTVDAGPDKAVETGPLEQCVGEVTLEGSGSSTAAPPLVFRWKDGEGAIIAEDTVATLPLSGPEGERDFTLEACDHLCQPVALPVAIRQPSQGGQAAACDATYCYYPAGTADCELACASDRARVDFDIEAGLSDATCDGIDDDCDGTLDDDYSAALTVCGVGRCAGTLGEAVCIDGSTEDTCKPLVKSEDERCNGVDDDCDGETDEGYGLLQECVVGQFGCASKGKVVCAADGLGTTCDAMPILGKSETCDGADNDCDGQTDEGFGLGEACAVGEGECSREGVRICVGETGFSGCDAPVVIGTSESCNARDDDCDGEVDEGACAALETEILTGPATISTEIIATFTYVDPTAPETLTYECSLDGGEWFRCDGRTWTSGELELGPHVMQVRTVGPTGEVDPTPAIYLWEIREGQCPADGEPPTLTCKPALTLECVALGAEIPWAELAPEASDTCGVELTREGPERAELGTNPILYTATDGAGNRAMCLTSVEVVDTVAPSIACPEPIAVDTPADLCGAEVDLPAPVVGDACAPTERLSVFDDAPSVFPVGETRVTMTVIDPSGHRATCETTVTVTDRTALTIACDADRVEVTPPEVCAWSGAVTATATDNCAVDVVTLERENTYPVGTHDVDFVASDEGGQEATCKTKLVVEDKTVPRVDCGVFAGGVVPVTASDACTVGLRVDEFRCVKLDGDARTELEGCDASLIALAQNGTGAEASVSIPGQLESSGLEVSFTATATDPSGNIATDLCTVTLPAREDADLSELYASGYSGCQSGGTAGLLTLLFSALGLFACSLRRR